MSQGLAPSFCSSVMLKGSSFNIAARPVRLCEMFSSMRKFCDPDKTKLLP